MTSLAASPKAHMRKQNSIGQREIKKNLIASRPDRPAPVPPGARKQPQTEDKPIPVTPTPTQGPNPQTPPSYDFVPIDIDSIYKDAEEGLRGLEIPGRNDVQDNVEEEGMTPTPPDDASTSRSGSIASDGSSMTNTHSSVDSPRTNLDGKIPLPLSPNAMPGPRSISEGPVAKSNIPVDLGKLRVHSTPEKPDKVTTTVTVISPRAMQPNPSSQPSSPSVNIPIPTGPQSMPSLTPFGGDSFSGMEPVRPLSASGIVKISSQPGTPKNGSPIPQKKWYGQLDNGLILKSKHFVHVVKGGVLEKIIHYLVNQASRDTDTTNALLLNYRKYIEPTQLLELLFNKLHDALNEEKFTRDQVALRCINLIQYWVSSHYHDFADDAGLLKNLQERLAALNDDRAKPIEKTIQKQEAKYRTLLAKPPLTILNPNAKKVNMLELKPAVVSQQLCLFEHELFRAIHPKEFLNQNWEKHKEKAPNICRMVQWFNAFADWISGTILQAGTSKEREKLTKFWIQVADQCRINNNFNAVQEIMSAFTSNALYRVKPLWDKINKSKKTMAVLNNLRVLVDPANNHTTYRTELKGVIGACIPFMALILRDLIHIEDGNPNILPIEGRNDIINFDKATKISAIIGHQSPSILGFQTELYKFAKVEAVYNIFHHGLCVLSEDERYQLSLKIAPRKTAK